MLKLFGVDVPGLAFFEASLPMILCCILFMGVDQIGRHPNRMLAVSSQKILTRDVEFPHDADMCGLNDWRITHNDNPLICGP